MVIELISDIEAIKNLKFLPEKLLEKAVDGQASIIGGYENDQLIVIGMFSYVKNYNRMIHIDYLYVLEDYREKGIGKEYLKQVEEVFKKLGVERFIFEYAGNFFDAEPWEAFISKAGYKPLSNRPIESIWDYFKFEPNYSISEKLIEEIDEDIKIKFCNEKKVVQILNENPKLKKYLEEQGLSLTDASLIFEENGKVIAALVIQKTENSIILLGAFGADGASRAQIYAIIAMFKYLNKIYDFDSHDVTFRIENTVIERALKCMMREKDIERAYVLSAKEV